MNRTGTTRRVAGAIRSAAAFTLIELLVVISIIAVLISLLLPSLGAAKRTTWNVICQANLKSLGTAIQMYLNNQKDVYAQFLDLWTPPEGVNLPPDQDRFRFFVNANTQLSPFLGDNNSNKPFECPAARDMLSVRDPQNITEMQRAFRVHTLPFLQFDQLPTVWTEYWFNDSRPRPPRNDSGVSRRLYRAIKHPEQVVWAADAPDEYPRHSTRRMQSRDDANAGGLADNLASNLLFGDTSVRMMKRFEYWPPEANDRYGAPGPFYNWGHYYPN